MTPGAVFSFEWRTYRDSHSGHELAQLTNSPAEDYRPYFSSPAITPDGRSLIFGS
jgi:hypothetical protein